MTGLGMESLRSGCVGKLTSIISMSLFTFVFYISPSGKAVADNIEKEQQRQAQITVAREKTPEQKLSRRLQSLQDAVVNQSMGGEKPGLFSTLAFWQDDDPLSSDKREQLQGLLTDLLAIEADAMGGFYQIQTHISDKKLPAVAAKRQAAAMATFKQQFSETKAVLKELLTTKDLDRANELWQQLKAVLENQQFKRSHSPFDPNKLPFSNPNSKVREPKVTNFDLQSALGLDSYKGVQVASNGPLPSSVTAALFSAKNSGQPADTFLQETPDIVITDEMRTLAAELNYNPTEIYSWVHNNIRFIPSYGSIQGAAMTLDTRRGNATDTASLLIGLLRASNIPARYAYGTVEVPVEKVMNWVGGVEVPAAAQNLMGQGGIPNTGLLYGGKVTQIRMEHTWAEAWVDFEPSRGVKNRTGDNWIPMDASFKQYEFTDGMALQEQVPFDAQALVDDIQANATINEEQGWVQNLPQQSIEQQLQAYQQQLEDYIANQNPDATVGEVLGLQEVKVKPAAPLAAGLPYRVLATSERFAEVPEKLRHKFKYQLQAQLYGQPGTTLFTFEQPTVEVAGKKLALSFRPSTEDDEQIIASYLPQPNEDGSPIDPSQLPDTLPGYLINMTAEFTVDGEVQLAQDAGTMGTELYSTIGLYSPTHGWTQANNKPVAGEYRAIGLDLQGVSAKQAEQMQQRMENTKSKIESSDISDMSKHDLLGDIVYSTIFSYFGLNDLQDQIAAESNDVVQYRAPSFGLFMTNVIPMYWYGIARDVQTNGLVMDVDNYSSMSIHKRNDLAAWVQNNQTSGSRTSAMEHLVPEQLVSSSDSPVEGISAVKALAVAAGAGQKIFTITNSNLDEVISNIKLDLGIRQEIRQSVEAGKVVTAHEENIVLNGWVGAGYLIIDPETGAGAYKISGGSNGGFIDPEKKGYDDILGFIGFALPFLKITLLTGLSAIIALGLNVKMIMDYAKIDHKCEGLNYLIALSILVTVLGLLAFFSGPLIAIVIMYAAMLSSKAAMSVAESKFCRVK